MAQDNGHIPQGLEGRFAVHLAVQEEKWDQQMRHWDQNAEEHKAVHARLRRIEKLLMAALFAGILSGGEAGAKLVGQLLTVLGG